MLNELFRTYKKIIFAALILMCSIVFWFFGCHRKQPGESGTVSWEKTPFEQGGYGYSYQIDDLSGTVVYGVKGYTVKDQDIPVNVNMTSAGGDFSGLVKIIVPGSNGGGIAYQSAIQCLKGEESSVELSIPQLGNASYFCFEILDQYGTTLLSKMEIPAYSEWIDPESQAGMQICMGLLSDQHERLSSLDETQIETDSDMVRFRMINLDSSGFPTGRDALNMLSGILVDDFSIRTLDTASLNALKSWLRNGGRLIVATGEYGKKNLSGLEKELGLSPGEVETERIYFNPASGFTGELGLYLNSLTFNNNAGWNMTNWSEPASLYERSYGKGTVYALRFSFTDESILQWNRLDEMTQSLYRHVFATMIEGNADAESGLWSMELALNSFNHSQAPNAFYYGLFFLIYLLTLIFLAYFVLSRMKKREYIWGVVPVVAVLFTLCIIFRSRGTPSQAQSSFSSIRIVDDANLKNDIYFLYQNAEGESMDMNFISTVDQVVPVDFDYAQESTDYTQLAMIQEEYRISNTIKGYDISFSEATPGTVRMLKMTENKSMNYGEKTRVFSADIHSDHTTFSGEITNLSRKDFDKVVVIRGNQYWSSSAMKGGSGLTISKEEIRTWSPADDEYVLTQDEDDSVTQDVLSYVLYRYMKNNNDPGDLIIIGVTLDDNYQLFRTRDASVGNQVSVYANHIDLDLPEKMDCRMDINREFLESDITYDDLLTRVSEEEKVEVEYRFDPNRLVWTMARSQDDFLGKIYAYNYQTKEKDVIFRKPGQVMTLEELEPYLSEMNVMRITYKQSDKAENYNLPILSVWLKRTVRKE